ncbi:MAG: 50S ribosomal protein L11 methyltransferase [Bacteroidia bacterium]|nr:50S ribosomal protein L11 methyltransferase [Bacteroidia bacterium]NNF30349.1 50S ribosomal protein L11 methyltransferase [Flavobacteriaceae bacterium]MBT8276425.1 50S ribosomal protein L11 methyltransferase [Bacteroidia bacterium]NNJ80941.1 50S ribosomal protein L11 methyltransferase [Flavobacteriaceae bacterium]NNK53506.1 50S ribosomal protein L11 methyltransferase [Flavobacteriaceae bacterium]
MIYLGYHFKVIPRQPGTEILIAELAEAGFESFVETEEGVTAYIQKEDWKEDIFHDVRVLRSDEFEINYSSEVIDQVNWNEEWERNFDPIEVSDTCVVRAPFHREYSLPYEIVIEPKMSFGTGHHETTHMMLEYLLESDLEGKTVLDMGCGTAVLAILAEMRGADAIDAIDIDEWCVENSEENVARNACKNLQVFLGDSRLLKQKNKYDIIIANINRNILLNDMPVYTYSLKKEGILLLSGFYLEDLSLITETCNKLQMQYVDNKVRNNWIAAKFVN